ncbi:uncharacterized protein LOC131669662 [Phymastichus coffea]|uniref:uncharacterized protein LOC131669662 n=1 Tax=Phymastichus coffea TaxID=108790 RepID=UPI00273C7B7A|nr:uncharacterized protein LOC131669662 [Phymastichus coffea]
MYFGCKCLNVSIKTKGSELNDVNINDAELNIKEQAEIYFDNNIAMVKDLDTIKKEHPALVEVKNVDGWAVYRCYNCMTYTHAMHQDYGATLVLVNANIITSEKEINNLKTSNSYSPVFRIIIDSNKMQEMESLEPQIKFSVSHLPSNSRLALAILEQQLEQAIQQQAHLIDSKIREFTRQQYEILDKFKERAHSEHSFLTRLICSEQNTINGTNYTETLPAAVHSIQPNKTTSVNDATDTTANLISRNSTVSLHSPHKSYNIGHINGNSQNSDSQIRDASSYDGEPLFLLEGMDDSPPLMNRHHIQVSDQESDTDDSGNEVIHVPRNHRSGHPTLAKSLPVTVPTFHSFSQRLAIQDDDDEQISRDPMDPHNIQASIKALAKSVHGDTVFGDLPRPRFSTKM